MGLRRQHIEAFARHVARALHDAQLLTAKLPEVEEQIAAVIQQDMAEESALEDAADKLLQQQLRAVGGRAEIDQHKARMLIKKELAKQKGFVL